MPTGNAHTDKTQSEKSEWNTRKTPQPQPVILRESSLQLTCSRVSSSGAGESEMGVTAPCPRPEVDLPAAPLALKLLNKQPTRPSSPDTGCRMFSFQRPTVPLFLPPFLPSTLPQFLFPHHSLQEEEGDLILPLLTTALCVPHPCPSLSQLLACLSLGESTYLPGKCPSKKFAEIKIFFKPSFLVLIKHRYSLAFANTLWGHQNTDAETIK